MSPGVQIALTGFVHQTYISRMIHLADYMVANNLSDEQVAEALGCSRVTVSRIRRRKTRPSWEIIQKLKEFTGCAVTADDFAELTHRGDSQ